MLLRLSLYLFWVSLLSNLAAQDIYTHSETGLPFPETLGVFQHSQTKDLGKREYGTIVSYLNEDAGAKGDFFLYPLSSEWDPNENPKMNETDILKEIFHNVKDAVYVAQKMG